MKNTSKKRKRRRGSFRYDYEPRKQAFLATNPDHKTAGRVLCEIARKANL